MRSYFEAFIETNTTVQSDFDFDARCWNYSIFYFRNYVHAWAVGSVIVPHMHATLTFRTAVRLVWFTAGRKLAILFFLLHLHPSDLSLSLYTYSMPGRSLFPLLFSQLHQVSMLLFINRGEVHQRLAVGNDRTSDGVNFLAGAQISFHAIIILVPVFPLKPI